MKKRYPGGCRPITSSRTEIENHPDFWGVIYALKSKR